MSFHTSDIEPTTPEIFGRVSVGLFMLFSFAVRSSLTAFEAEIWSTGVGIDGFLYSFIATRKHLVKEDTYVLHTEAANSKQLEMVRKSVIRD